MKLVIVIPAFNESAVIYKVVKSLPMALKGFTQVLPLVVDDGSVDNTMQEASRAGAALNFSLEASVKTRAAKLPSPFAKSPL